MTGSLKGKGFCKFFRKCAMVCPNTGVHLYIKACEVNRFVTVHVVNLH